jgi:hypothetical protein
MSEYGYIPESPEQSFGNNKGIFTPKDIYDLTRADKYTNYGQLELIETVDVTSMGVANFTNLGSYNVHFATYNNIKVETDSAEVVVELSADGGSSWIRSGGDYQFGSQYGDSNGSFLDPNSSTANHLPISYISGNATYEKTNGYVYFYNLINYQHSYATMHCTSLNYAGQYVTYFGYAGLEDTDNRVINALRFLSSDSPFGITGSVSLYGIKGYN